MATPVFDVILGKMRDAVAGATTVGAALFQATSAAVACRALSRGVIVDHTVPSQAALVDPVASQSGADLLVTITGTAPANGTILRARVGTGALPGNLSAYDPYAGPIYWVVSSSGSTFKLSLTKGGAAIAYSSAGTAGWTLTQEDYETVTVSTDVNGVALSLGSGFRGILGITSDSGLGYVTNAAQGLPNIQVNGDAGAKYQYNANEQSVGFYANGVVGNVFWTFSSLISITGSNCVFNFFTNGKYGTDRTQANSVGVSGAIGIGAYDKETGTVTLTSLTLTNSSNAGAIIKAGTRIRMAQLMEVY